MSEQFVTVRQVADAAGVTDRTVRRWLDEEQIATFQRGKDRRILINRADVDHHLTPRLMPRRGQLAASEAAAQ